MALHGKHNIPWSLGSLEAGQADESRHHATFSGSTSGHGTHLGYCRSILDQCVRRTILAFAMVLVPLLASLPIGCDRRDPASRQSMTTAQSDPAATLDRAIDLVSKQRPKEAMDLVQQVLIASPDHPDAIAIAAQIHATQEEFSQAANLAVRHAALVPDGATASLLRAFDWQLRGGDFGAAEASLVKGIQLQPQSVELHRTLANLLNGQGRRYEARRHVVELARQGRATQKELMSLIDLSGPFPLVSFHQFYDESETTLFELGDARFSFHDVIHRDRARQQIERVAEAFPDVPAVAAFHGVVLASEGDLEALKGWSQSLPAGTDEHPEYWATLAHWLNQMDRKPEAIRACCETLRRDPTHRQALRWMIAALEGLGQTDQTETAKKHLAVLDQIFRRAKQATSEDAVWIAGQLQNMTRPWESSCWFEYAASLSEQLESRLQEFAQRRNTIAEWERTGTQQAIEKARLETLVGFDPTTFPITELAAVASSRAPSSVAESETHLAFSDVSKSASLSAMFDSGYDVDSGEFLIYQANGGGLAALDFDLDGRCDVYVVQSGGEPGDLNDSTANQLFRLLPDGTFTEIAHRCGAADRSFGQGVGVGDINQDGFPDLLVANIGANTLFINQGDGTFRIGTYLLPESSVEWTSSIGLGDLDGDHLPEIVEVNYINDPRAYEVKCEGRQINCRPQLFRAATDRILRSRGDGSYEDWDGAADIGDRPNFGFGVIIANIDGEFGNDVFISNDGDLNHYWSSQPAEKQTPGEPQSARFSLLESAGIRGCSIGEGGQAQGCMGIAAGDFDRNQKLDLHVTNFHNEPVNLYLQTQSGFFIDDALKLRLASPSRGVLGFGTQSADFDNDGWADLAVLNGHIYDATYANIPFRMKPQLFHGRPEGFTAQDPLLAGDYWQHPQLGRTLVLLDWNRDGRMDLLANHLDRPITLLQNDSDSNHWLQMELVGVQSERDAIGAEIVVDAGDGRWTGWQLGGDGYMASCEPIIHFGLGDLTVADRVEIRWPSGNQQVLENVPLNQRVLVIEGDGELYSREN